MSKENNSTNGCLLARELLNWSTDTALLHCPEHQKQLLTQLFNDWLTTPFADNRDDRNELMVVLENFKTVLGLLSSKSEEDLNQVNRINLKLQDLCTTATA
ncbi:hypothetical protein JJL45_05115 [Tamlana sp. s12]|uniref:hypothetical protein n=1 Tax=Tamlana sp. s12 TaxID=1630406 RepID=UPI0007FFE1C5|nr:hypothetical protein [Tamlana sp. s12]OBQ56116.1 hypothetical protein VQ01_06945 [Tamlana sp. s12]QQY83371.1 hypothetical protein JJL45_05115 [Tamlana sp. s12]